MGRRALGFVTFSHRVFKNADGGDAVAAMRAAAGDDRFHILQSAQSRPAAGRCPAAPKRVQWSRV